MSLGRESVMPVVISDQTLEEAGLDERDALIEFACRLFDAGKLTLWSGARLAKLSRVEFEAELLARRIPIHRPPRAPPQTDSGPPRPSGELSVAITGSFVRETTPKRGGRAPPGPPSPPGSAGASPSRATI